VVTYKQIGSGFDKVYDAMQETGSRRQGLWRAIQKNPKSLLAFMALESVSTLAELVGIGMIVQAWASRKKKKEMSCSDRYA
jgi:hypothetical protein